MRKSLFNLRGCCFFLFFFKFQINEIDAKVITEKVSYVLLFANILGSSNKKFTFWQLDTDFGILTVMPKGRKINEKSYEN